MAEYKVQFEVFEGPLDLLLYLVKKEEVDIYDVDLTRLATQFVEYVELMRQLDLEVAGEFLVMASTLMYIKSRELLPVDLKPEVDPDEEEADPRWELIRQLVEYKKFKDAAGQLHTLETRQEDIFPRRPVKPELPAVELTPRSEASLFDLINAVSQILRRFQERVGPRDIYEDKWSVSEKIEHLRNLVTERESIEFSNLFEQTTSRSEVVVTFLALLELIRLRVVSAAQEAVFGRIVIRRATPALLPPGPDPQAEPTPAPTPSDPPPPAPS
jgi:segregation and condensation protein A